jgi:glycosyltransferase involved in cell wall biosynthesis
MPEIILTHHHNLSGRQLAIVIPAYKTKYLDAALASVAAQTNKNFKVYVCDDGSREDIKSIADKYSGEIDINYYRFADNAGRNSLVKHWNRSVELTNEEWIWLFSDDDVMSPNCVQNFLDALASTKEQYDVYRFNIEMIDAEGSLICIKEPHPVTESAYEFLTRRLLSKSLSAAVEYIFRKEVFEKNNGFVSFPLAYCSDDASWIEFAGDKLIYTIPSEKVYWRSSGINISSAKGLQDKKATALVKFIEFIIKKYPVKKAELLYLAEPWFYENLNHMQARLSFFHSLAVSKKIRAIFHNKWGVTLKKITASQLQRTRFANKVQKWSGF